MEPSNILNVLFEQESVVVETKNDINVQKINIHQTLDFKLCLVGQEVTIPLQKTTLVLKLAPHAYTFVNNATFTTLKFINTTDMSVFEAILETTCIYRVKPQPPSTAQTITKSIVSGLDTTQYVVISGIQGGSNLVSSGIKKTGDIIKEQIQIKEHVSVPQPLKSGVELTERVVVTTSEATGKIVSDLVEGVTWVATSVISGVYNSIPQAPGVENTPNEHLENFKEVLHGTAKCIGGIVVEATQGIKNMVHEGAQTTAQVLDKKYGEDVATVSLSGMNIVKGGVETYFNVSSLNLKTLALATTKNTTQQLIQEEKVEQQDKEEENAVKM